MCGIVGVYHFDPRRPVERADLDRARDVIAHRGPDDAGSFMDGHVGIGMRRLAIIDVQSGQQPLSNEDDTVWIVFNGEIYNHLGLRARLMVEGHRFRTASDTETILHLYEDHGVDCLGYLRGMFAFAIWDRPRQRLFVARDRLGIKPLFWMQDGERFAFASEMKALATLPGFTNGVNWTAIDACFTYGYIPAPLTAYTSVSKLPSAHYLMVEPSGVSAHRYWDLRYAPKLRGSEAQIADDFQGLMEDAVGLHLMSEVPLGAFLSGGIDSGLMVAMMSRRSTQSVRTFTIGFGGQRGSFADERPFAREVSQRYACQHQAIEVLPDIGEALEAAATSFDEPFADDSIIPTHCICRAAKGQVTVVLTGLGGDENFAGYERHLGLQLSGVYSRLPRLLRDRILGPLVRQLPEEKGGHYRINHLKRFAAGASEEISRRYQSYLCAMPEGRRRTLYSPDVARLIDFERVEMMGREHFLRPDEGDILDRALYQDINTYLPEDILALTDRIGMHYSLELRVPFVDHEVIEYCARIPSRMKIRGLQKKHLLRRIAREQLPDSVISRPKQGFSSPMAAWLNTDLRPDVDRELAPSRIARDAVLMPATISALVEEHAARRNLNDKTLFALLVFQRWFGRRSTIG